MAGFGKAAALGVAGALGLAGCAGVEGEEPDLRGTDTVRERLAGNGSVFEIFGGGGSIGNATFGSGRSDALAASVNRHLWQASLDTLSFLPLASTDPFSGVIATDWGTAAAAPGERYKVTAYVTGTALTAGSLRVAVFREVQEAGGWVPAPVAAETPRQIEDAILLRARQIRIAEREGEAAAG